MTFGKSLAVSILISFLATGSYGRMTSDRNELIESIQSVAKSKGMVKARINLVAPNNFNTTREMDVELMTKIQELHFEGQFLIIDENYFIVDKLLYFNLRKDFIDFYFEVN